MCSLREFFLKSLRAIFVCCITKYLLVHIILHSWSICIIFDEGVFDNVEQVGLWHSNQGAHLPENIPKLKVWKLNTRKQGYRRDKVVWGIQIFKQWREMEDRPTRQKSPTHLSKHTRDDFSGNVFTQKTVQVKLCLYHHNVNDFEYLKPQLEIMKKVPTNALKQKHLFPCSSLKLIWWHICSQQLAAVFDYTVNALNIIKQLEV